MMVVVCYDVDTTKKEGRRRLRRVAKTCLNFGQRVQDSVFECLVEPAQFVDLKNKLGKEYSAQEDSLRFYFLGKNWKNRVEHMGTKEPLDLEGLLVI
ncbi:MAG: CRISPR-associated endonuclease Cas2 [Chrysiogenales bacterium]|jgi:CRISPR-associated protein Cas2